MLGGSVLVSGSALPFLTTPEVGTMRTASSYVAVPAHFVGDPSIIKRVPRTHAVFISEKGRDHPC